MPRVNGNPLRHLSPAHLLYTTRLFFRSHRQRNDDSPSPRSADPRPRGLEARGIIAARCLPPSVRKPRCCPGPRVEMHLPLTQRSAQGSNPGESREIDDALSSQLCRTHVRGLSFLSIAAIVSAPQSKIRRHRILSSCETNLLTETHDEF